MTKSLHPDLDMAIDKILAFRPKPKSKGVKLAKKPGKPKGRRAVAKACAKKQG